MTLQKYYSYRYDHIFLSLVTFNNKILKEIIYETLNIKVDYAKVINSKMVKEEGMQKKKPNLYLIC